MASTLIETSLLEMLVQSGLPEAALEVYVDAVDGEIVRLFGPHGGEHTVRLRVDPSSYVALPYPAASVSTVAEWGESQTPDAAAPVADFVVTNGGRALRRTVGVWKRNVEVAFTPTDDTARRRGVLVDLVKEALAQTGYSRQRVGSFDVSAISLGQRDAILGRLRQNYGGGGLLA